MLAADLADWCQRHDVPGAAVAQVSSAGLREMVVSGVTDVETRNPLTANSMFRIYSVSKMATAAAVVQLVRAGVVDLDSPVSEYVPGLSRRGGEAATISVRSSLGHTSGLWPDSLTWTAVGRNPGDLAVEVRRDFNRAFGFAAQGRHYSYCNASFNLSALLIEKMTAEPFDRAMREMVWDPAQMPTTTHDPCVAMTYPMAQHHQVIDGRLQVIHRPLVGSKWLAGSQCYCTPTELASFASWMLRDLRAETIPQRRIDQPVADLRLDVGTRYGLGCYLSSSLAGDTLVGHEGFFQGSWVKVVLDPSHDRGLVWMDNRGDELRDDRYDVVEQLMPGVTGPAADAAATVVASKRRETVMPEAGEYRRLGGRGLTLDVQGDDLSVQHEGRRRRLEHSSPGIWSAAASVEDTGTWRPHAGSKRVCLGVSPIKDGRDDVVHLNALPYLRC